MVADDVGISFEVDADAVSAAEVSNQAHAASRTELVAIPKVLEVLVDAVELLCLKVDSLVVVE